MWAKSGNGTHHFTKSITQSLLTARETRQCKGTHKGKEFGAKNFWPISATLIYLYFIEEAWGGNQSATTFQEDSLSQATRQSLLVYLFGTGDREREMGQIGCLSGRLTGKSSSVKGHLQSWEIKKEPVGIFNAVILLEEDLFSYSHCAGSLECFRMFLFSAL